MIVPDKHDIIFIRRMDTWLGPDQQWWYPLEPPLPFNNPWWETEDKKPFADDSECGQTYAAWQTLRSLAQTCRTLRAIALPVLWSVCHVESVAQLGRIREALRASPYLVHHVRSFSLLWWPPGQHQLNEYAEEAGTLLDLAFSKDRWQLWRSLAEQHGCDILDTTQGLYFVLDGRQYDEPGRYSKPGDGEVPDHGRFGTRGPDGCGEDRLIKTAEQFNECLVEIIAHLTSLEAFGWDSAGIVMPRGVFDALHKLDSLKALHLNMEVHRCSVQMCESLLNAVVCLPVTMIHSTDQSTITLSQVPFWELTSNLVGLSFDFGTKRHFEDLTADEQDEQALLIELPAQPPTHEDWEARGTLNYQIAVRTVIAAATSHLRSLDIDVAEYSRVHTMQSPFAVRALLPFWINIQHWGEWDTLLDDWPAEAKALRHALAHASRWLNASSEALAPRSTRQLAGSDVQDLLLADSQDDYSPYGCISYYLPWLHKDKELAQQIASAWNAVVERGEADVVKCKCSRC